MSKLIPGLKAAEKKFLQRAETAGEDRQKILSKAAECRRLYTELENYAKAERGLSDAEVEALALRMIGRKPSSIAEPVTT